MTRFPLLVTLLLSLSAQLNAQAPYTNPVIGNPWHVEHEIADPYVLKWNGEYYQWHRVSLDFSIPDGQAAATIHFDAGVSSGLLAMQLQMISIFSNSEGLLNDELSGVG